MKTPGVPDHVVNADTLLPESALAWDYLGLTSACGADQMGLDRRLLGELRGGSRQRPILRFYRWTPPAVSYGYNQGASDSVRVEEARRLGYDVVQRPTGGRALLHKGDLCYAVISHKRWHPEFRTLSTTYRAISKAHRLALSMLGVTTSESVESGAKATNRLSPCFAMLNPFEVTVRGRKICGSAQFRAGEFFLQHGSLRIEDNWSGADLAEIWPAGLSLSAESVTSLELELGRIPACDEVAEVWREAFARVFQVELGCSG